MVIEARRHMRFAEARHVERDGPTELARRLHQRRPVARGARVAVHEHDRLGGFRRSSFKPRGTYAGGVELDLAKLAHVAVVPAVAPLAEVAVAPRRWLSRATSARGTAVASICAGPMLRVPNASITAATP